MQTVGFVVRYKMHLYLQVIKSYDRKTFNKMWHIVKTNGGSAIVTSATGAVILTSCTNSNMFVC